MSVTTDHRVTPAERIAELEEELAEVKAKLAKEEAAQQWYSQAWAERWEWEGDN